MCAIRNHSWHNTPSEKSPEEHNRVLQAECLIDKLPEEERALLQEYIERFSDCLTLEEPFLYQQGFIDGVRVMNVLKALYYKNATGPFY